MPELPEVETVMRGMEHAIKGRAIINVDQRRKNLRIPFPANFPVVLEGQKVQQLSRRAKYILVQLDSDKTVIMHLGMSGRVLLVGPDQKYEIQKHDHLILSFDDDSKMIFNDARRFGMVMLANTNEIESHKAFANLGPEPLGNHFSADVLFAALKNKKTNIKNALMDQRIVAGLGNIYVCESLFYAGIHPERICATITKAESEKLVQAIRDVLNKAIAAGGSTLKDYRHADGELGYFQHQFAVYDRAGETCSKCPGAINKCCIEKITQSGRSTYFCPQAQK